MIIEIKTVQVEFKYKLRHKIDFSRFLNQTERSVHQRPSKTSFHQETGGKTQQNNIFSSLLVNILP